MVDHQGLPAEIRAKRLVVARDHPGARALCGHAPSHLISRGSMERSSRRHPRSGIRRLAENAIWPASSRSPTLSMTKPGWRTSSVAGNASRYCGFRSRLHASRSTPQCDTRRHPPRRHVRIRTSTSVTPAPQALEPSDTYARPWGRRGAANLPALSIAACMSLWGGDT